MADLAPLYLECLAARRPGLGGMAILLTLRQPETWLYSAWLENLCGTKLTQDFEPYAATFRGSGDLTAINQAVRKACPGVPVQTAWLEDTGPARQGPATPLPDAFALPEPLLASLPAPRQSGH